MNAMRRHRLGLVVGKFAPLHLGHEWLIDQAAQVCERVLVLSYTRPEFDRCEAAVRRRWLAQRCAPHACHVIDDAWLDARCTALGIPMRPLPANREADAIHQQYLGWLLRDVLRETPDAMFASEAYVTPCAAALSAALGHVVQAVLVDPQRREVPISASVVRRDPAAHARWLSPVVRAAFVRRVLLLGGESSGKTTLAAALAREHRTLWAPEYGRELWEARGGRLDEGDLLAIAQAQIAREEQLALEASDLLFCDTSPLTTLGYGLWTHGRADPRLHELAGRHYDTVVLCAPDFPFVQDGTRRDPLFRLQQHAWYREQLKQRGWAYVEVAGGVEQRVAQVGRLLGRIRA